MTFSGPYSTTLNLRYDYNSGKGGERELDAICDTRGKARVRVTRTRGPKPPRRRPPPSSLSFWRQDWPGL